MTIPAFNLSYRNIIIMNVHKSSLNYNKVTTYSINISNINIIVCVHGFIDKINPTLLILIFFEVYQIRPFDINKEAQYDI